MATFSTWFDTFISEKRIDPETTITVDGPSGPNTMPLQIVFDAIKHTSPGEQRAIKHTLVKIDFLHRDPVHYFKHLAQAIAI